MHFLVVSLLALLAGTLLLAKTRKEALGKIFSFISWFFIVVGFVLFVGFLCGGLARMHHPGRMGHPGPRPEMRMHHFRGGMPGGMYRPGPGRFAPPRGGCGMQDSMMNCCKQKACCDSTVVKPCAKAQ